MFLRLTIVTKQVKPSVLIPKSVSMSSQALEVHIQ